VGEYTCALEIDSRIFSITYRLPVSLEAIQAGQYRADILAEMDAILQSIIWNVESEPQQPTATPTPLGYDATPNPAELTAAALETVVAFNQTDAIRKTGPFLEIPPELWAAPIAQLNPRRVYWHQNNLAVVLAETGATETGLYIGVPISSYAIQDDDTIQFTPEADGLYRFSKKRSD